MPDETSISQGVCPTKLILDSADCEDEFRHDEIAKAIADLIENGKEGCAIALTGPWGSGKSTVVELLKKRLGARKKEGEAATHTFVFDAWEHQGDPLRRSFLETFIAWCNCDGDKRHWIGDSAKWNKVIKLLARRLEKTKSKTTPNLTPMGQIGVVSLLVAPVALSVYQKIQLGSHRSLTSFLLFLGALPAGIALLTILGWIPQWWNNRNGKGKVRSVASFIYTSTQNRTSSRTSKTPDPTSVEFGKHYKKLLDEIFCEHENDRQLLLVIDNLDRVDRADALAIWATLKVFIDPLANSNRPDRKHRKYPVWVLVPFDPAGIGQLWTSGNFPDGSPLPSSNLLPDNNLLPKGNLSSGQLTVHFLEKTFQASFRVPPQILTNWKEYLLNRLREAFPENHTDAEFHDIFRLYDNLKVMKGEWPTPRNIKLFVNAIGSLHRQWQHGIHLQEQAAFAVINGYRDDVVAKLSGLADKDLSVAQLAGMLGNDWQRDLAAMYFNVDREVAYQALLYPQISNALISGDKDSLLKLATSPGFPEVYNRTIDTMAQSNNNGDGTNLALMALASSGLSNEPEKYAQSLRIIWKSACDARNWGSAEDKVVEGIVELVRFASEASVVSPIIRSVKNSLQGNPRQGRLTSDLWSKLVVAVLPALLEKDEVTVSREFNIPGNGEQYLATLLLLRKMNGFECVSRYVTPEAPDVEVYEALGRDAAAGKWNAKLTETVECMLSTAINWDWKPIVVALSQRVQIPTGPSPYELSALYETLFLISQSSGFALEPILECASNDRVSYDHFYQLLGANFHSSAALCTLAILSSNHSMDESFKYSDSAFSDEGWRKEKGRSQLTFFILNPKQNPQLLNVLRARFLQFHTYDEWSTLAETARKDNEVKKEYLIRTLMLDTTTAGNTSEITAKD